MRVVRFLEGVEGVKSQTRASVMNKDRGSTPFRPLSANHPSTLRRLRVLHLMPVLAGQQPLILIGSSLAKLPREKYDQMLCGLSRDGHHPDHPAAFVATTAVFIAARGSALSRSYFSLADQTNDHIVDTKNQSSTQSRR